MKKQDKRILEYDMVRIIAVILVVIGHCLYYSIFSYGGGVTLNFKLENMNLLTKLFYNLTVLLGNIIYTFHMPLFIALSGALFKNQLNKNKYVNLKELIIAKLKRLIMPFIIVTLLYSVPIKYISGYFSNSKNIFKDIIIGQLLIQGNTHLWFLPTLFLIFIVVYLVINKNIKKQYILLIFLALNIISNVIDINIIYRVFHYLIYFMIGFYFEDKRAIINDKINNSKKINLYLIIGLCILICFNFINFDSNIILKIIKKILDFPLALIGISITYVFCLKLINKKGNINKYLETINKCSFGIYLYSDPLNYIIIFLFNLLLSKYLSSLLGLSLLFITRLVITLFASIGITEILKKLKIKYIC